MKKLEELESKLREMKDSLSKTMDMFGAEAVNTADVTKMEVAPEGSKNRESYKKEFEKADSCEDIAEDKIKEHEDKKHSKEGHKKEHDKMGIKSEKITLHKNGQWSLEKAEEHKIIGLKPKENPVPKAKDKMQSEHGAVKNIDPKTGKVMSTVTERKGVKLGQIKKD